MASRRSVHETSASPILETLWGGWKTQALVAAIELEVFSHVEAGLRTAGQVAAAAHANPRGVRVLLDALVPMGFLGKRADRYKLRPAAQTFLVKGREYYLGALASPVRAQWQDWAHFPDAVRSGRPYALPYEAAAGGKTAPGIATALFEFQAQTAESAVQALPPKLIRQFSNILHVASGSGGWSIPFAQASPQARVTAVDCAPAVKFTRQTVSRFGLTARYTFRAENPHQADFGRESFDLILIPHVLYRLGPSAAREFARRCAAALRFKGTLLIAEFVPNDVRTAPLLPLLCGLDALLHTREGDLCTFRQINAWLKGAGLHNARVLRLATAPTVILATR